MAALTLNAPPIHLSSDRLAVAPVESMLEALGVAHCVGCEPDLYIWRDEGGEDGLARLLYRATLVEGPCSLALIDVLFDRFRGVMVRQPIWHGEEDPEAAEVVSVLGEILAGKPPAYRRTKLG